MLKGEEFDNYRRYQSMLECGLNVNHVVISQVKPGHSDLETETVQLCGSNIEMVIDSGSPVNLINEQVFNMLKLRPKLSPIQH